MKVLDLGCGCASSSIFLAREYGVTVFATDLWCSLSDNLYRIRDAGLESRVYPIHADARLLPFAADFFDAIVSVDSYFYFGTDDHYLNYLARFVKPSGAIAIAQAMPSRLQQNCRSATAGRSFGGTDFFRAIDLWPKAIASHWFVASSYSLPAVAGVATAPVLASCFDLRRSGTSGAISVMRFDLPVCFSSVKPSYKLPIAVRDS